MKIEFKKLRLAKLYLTFIILRYKQITNLDRARKLVGTGNVNQKQIR